MPAIELNGWGFSQGKWTIVFAICVLLSPRSPIFISLGQGVHENQQSYMGKRKNKILGKNHLIIAWIDGFPLFNCIFALYYYIFGVSPFGNKSEWILLNHTFPCITRTAQYERILLKCLFHVLGTCSVSMGKFRFKSVLIIRFLGVISIQQIASRNSTQPYGLTKMKIYTYM